MKIWKIWILLVKSRSQSLLEDTIRLIIIMLVKVKDVPMADQLEEKLKEATNPST